MPALTPVQLAQLSKSVGFKGDQVSTIVAIALGESGGNPREHNPNASTGDNSYGLWQINMLGDLGPSRRSQFKLKTNEDLFNPGVNARAAYAISSKGTNFTPWSVYKSGKYKDYLSSAKKAAAEAEGLGTVGLDDVLKGLGLGPLGVVAHDQATAAAGTLIASLQNIGGGVQQIAGTALKVGQLGDAVLRLMLPNNLTRLAAGIAGFTFVFIGIFLLGREVRS